jgi:hypothetical protein
MKKNVPLIALAIICSATSYGQTGNKSKSVLTTSDNVLSLAAPIGWQQLAASNGALLTLMSPKENADDHFPEMITVRSLTMSQIHSLEELKQFQEENVKKSGKAQLITSSIDQRNKIPFVKTEFALNAHSVDGVFQIISFLYKGKIYLLSMTIERSKLKQYANVLPVVFQSVSLQ